MTGISRRERPNRRRPIWRLLRFAAAVLIAVFLIRAFGFEPFRVTHLSMMPTLWPGDQTLVAKYAYGYSRHSFPIVEPPFDGRLPDRPVRRGDVVVFRLDRGRPIAVIKRVIGLPGERVQLRGDTVWIDGEPVTRDPLPPLVLTPQQAPLCHRNAAFYSKESGRCKIRRIREILPNGVAYSVLEVQNNGPDERTRVFTVPKDHLFVLGDNRDLSKDSRHPLSVGTGYVPQERLMGRAETVLYSRSRRLSLWNPGTWFDGFRPARWWEEL